MCCLGYFIFGYENFFNCLSKAFDILSPHYGEIYMFLKNSMLADMRCSRFILHYIYIIHTYIYIQFQNQPFLKISYVPCMNNSIEISYAGTRCAQCYRCHICALSPIEQDNTLCLLTCWFIKYIDSTHVYAKFLWF